MIYKNGNEIALDNEKYIIDCPDDTTYKDITASCILVLHDNFNSDYFKSININVKEEAGNKMYEENYLITLRIAYDREYIYLKGKVASEMRKQTVYIVNIKIYNKAILETQCECATGSAPTAYCKHVRVVFNAISDFMKNKSFKTRLTCTEKLQSFHQTKKFKYSPIKSKSLPIAKSV